MCWCQYYWSLSPFGRTGWLLALPLREVVAVWRCAAPGHNLMTMAAAWMQRASVYKIAAVPLNMVEQGPDVVAADAVAVSAAGITLASVDEAMFAAADGYIAPAAATLAVEATLASQATTRAVPRHPSPPLVDPIAAADDDDDVHYAIPPPLPPH